MDSVSEHRATSPNDLRFFVCTVSDTRTPENDTGGNLVVDLLAGAKHQVVARRIVPDEAALIRSILNEATTISCDAVLFTGGTGLSSRDQTFETVSALFTKSIPGYGELFRWLSYHEIGAAAMLSRAAAGLVGKMAVFTMPGSPAGVKLAMEKLILPEIRHLLREVRR